MASHWLCLLRRGSGKWRFGRPLTGAGLTHPHSESTSRPMHALWNIPELVQMIFGLTDRRTLRELAQVCRSLWLQALPFLWRRVKGLTVLLCMLPDDAVLRRRDGTIDMCPFTVTRALNRSDWDRFMLHSRHIRNFCLPLSLQDVLLHLAPHLPSTPIMPNLTFVRFEINWNLKVNLELLRHFLPPSVTDVDVCAIRQPEDGQRFLNALAMEMKLPRLSSFSITVGSRPAEDVGSSVCHVLRSHRGIERIAMDIGHSHQIHEVFRLAGQLPQLRHFEMCNYDGKALSLDHNSFPALESLKLSSASRCLDSLLVQVPSEKIIRLEVTVEDPLPAFQDASSTPLADSFHTIGTFAHLKFLSIHLEVEATWETMQHILGCRELQTLVITALRGSSLELQESHLEQMGQAWPSLKTLRLQLHDPNAPETTYLKLSYLRVIATEFRNLQTLSIKFDATAAAISRFSLPDLTVPAQYSLQKLDVDMSLIDEEGIEVVGRLLVSWWPNLLEITCRYYNLFATHWSAVQKYHKSHISQDTM